MRFFFSSSLLIILFASIISGQESARRQRFDELNGIVSQIKLLQNERQQITDQQIELLLKIKSVSKEDESEAERFGAKAIRLFPCCEMADMISEMSEITFADIPISTKAKLSFSTFQLAYVLVDEKTQNGLEYPETITFSGDSLSFIETQNGNHGFIYDLGQTPFDKIGEQTSEVSALTEYAPPTDEKNIRKDFTSNDLTFTTGATVKVGNTYILRAIKYSTTPIGLDGIFAVKVQRQDKNGSIVLFIKPVKIFDPPKLKNPEIEERDRVFGLGVVAKLKEEFAAKGFNEIEVRVVDRVIFLKGSVPFGKTDEAVAIAKNLTDFVTVKSELSEK